MTDDSYRKLEIYQLARSLANLVQNVSLTLDADRFGPQESEFRQSSRAVVRDLVDAYLVRSDRALMLHRLRSARAWCERTLALLHGLSRDGAFETEEQHVYLSSSYQQLNRMILKAIETDLESPESPLTVREEAAEYAVISSSVTLEAGPLEGKIVLVTRAEHQGQSFAELLGQEGAYGLGVPMIEIKEPPSWKECDKAIINLRKYDGVIFTSANAVKMFLQRMDQLNKEARQLLTRRSVYAVGSKTQAVLEEAKIPVTAIPSSFSAADLATVFDQKAASGKSFLLPKGDLVRDTITRRLRELDAVVDEVVVYINERPDTIAAKHLHQLLENREVDVVTFFSPSSVVNFVEMAGTDLVSSVPVAVIGPTTARAAKEFGLNVRIVAKQSTADSLVQTMREYFSR